jgi:hypothetical protein
VIFRICSDFDLQRIPKQLQTHKGGSNYE